MRKWAPAHNRHGRDEEIKRVSIKVAKILKSSIEKGEVFKKGGACSYVKCDYGIAPAKVEVRWPSPEKSLREKIAEKIVPLISNVAVPPLADDIAEDIANQILDIVRKELLEKILDESSGREYIEYQKGFC